ncbi:Transcription initiation factor TFIID subunit 12 [Pseudocyphellaria aurata]|nr:Transcription initiation factor TFIID subunit 12 [Pseudocyphellaria aurata]
MNNPNLPGPPTGLPPLTSLIKPEQVAKLAHFSEPSKVSYAQGISKLWETIHNRPQDSPEYLAAYRKLVDVTNQIRNGMRKIQDHQANQTAITNGQRSSIQGQQDHRQQDPRQQPPQVNHVVGQPQAQPQGVEQFSQKVLTKVQSQTFLVPLNLSQQGPEVAGGWLKEARLKYAQHLQRFETATIKLAELHQISNTRTHAGKTFTQEEAQTLNNRKNQCQRAMQEARDYLAKFQAQQDLLKANNNVNSNFDSHRESGVPQHTTEQPQDSQLAQQHKTTDPGQPHTITSAVEAARNQANTDSRSAISPLTPAQLGPPTVIQGSSSQPPGNQGQPPSSHPNSAVSRVPPSQPNMNPQSGTPQGPLALSYHDALTKSAQSHSQPNYQQSTPQASSHAHPQISNRDSQTPNSVKMPIPKDLKVPQHQPVTMGPARPTLTGGPTNGAMGPMGQPAIQKHPGYVLEGEGERVLSKKKLEELVRQVTGGSGVDNEEGDILSAEVEDTLLQVADDFVDQVIVGACRVAKLRQSSTLELRDIQLILERNYNIRVPGYASDELRTVRKIQPTQAWTQKLSAVQAAKVTGGKTDS